MPSVSPGKKRQRKFGAVRGSSSRQSAGSAGRPCPKLVVTLWVGVAALASVCLVFTFRLGLHQRSLRGDGGWELSPRQPPAEFPPPPPLAVVNDFPPVASSGPPPPPVATPAPAPAPPPVASAQPPGAARPTAAVATAAPTGPGSDRGCTTEQGYANKQITGGVEKMGVGEVHECRDQCRALPECTCYAWKQDGFCHMGASVSCAYVGSQDDFNWKFGRCADGIQDDGSLAWRKLAPSPPLDWLDVHRRNIGRNISRNVHAFYYMWYGSLGFDKRWVHWNHEFLPHWDKRVAAKFPEGRHDPSRGDIASAFWPSLGPYSSRDPAVVKAHVQQMVKASVGVAVVSWYPSGKMDGSGQFDSEEVLPKLMNEAARQGVEVAIHIEPYEGRSPGTVRNDIEFILQKYGRHPALHRRVASGAHRKILDEKHKNQALPVFYVYDSYHTPAKEWASLLLPGAPGSNFSIRNTGLDAIVFCLWVQREHEAYLSDGGFDGAYTYFAAEGSTWGSTPANWPGMATFAKGKGALFVPSVGPGYNDLKVRPWNKQATRQRANGQYYDHMFEAAAALKPSIVSLTSWNEWHEGTNLEPASQAGEVPRAAVPGAAAVQYEDYGSGGPETYLVKTRAAAAILAQQQAQVPVLFVTHVRAQYLRRALEVALRFRPHPEVFPLIASQDGTDQKVAQLIKDHMEHGLVWKHLVFSSNLKTGYQRLCAHYRWALDQILDVLGFQQLIILEEDIEISPDFFSYMTATLPLLWADPELFCVSAWNDNGKPQIASDSEAIFRTDFFPGLGWMMLRSIWLEVRDGWPPSYWDEYMRRKDVRKGRHCLRPEVSRTHTFGEVGVSKGQFYKQHLVQNRLNSDNVDWSKMDLRHISTAGHFDDWLAARVRAAKEVPFQQLQEKRTCGELGSMVVRYADPQWKQYATFFGFMDDVKEGVRRGTYRGVLPFTWQHCRVYLVRDWPLT